MADRKNKRPFLNCRSVHLGQLGPIRGPYGADFQKIVATGISNELLRWKGIEATEKLAQSSNAKVVVVGFGKDGLPLILGGN